MHSFYGVFGKVMLKTKYKIYDIQSKNKIKKINIINNFVEFRKQNPNQTLNITRNQNNCMINH